MDSSESPSRCRIYATVPSGFEFAARDEACERFGEDITAIHTERGALRFSMPIERVSEIPQLRAVDHLFVVVLETKKTFNRNKTEAMQEMGELLKVRF